MILNLKILFHFELFNNISDKKVLKDDGPEIKIGSSSLEINILNKPSSKEGKPTIFLIIFSSFSPKYISQ